RNSVALDALSLGETETAQGELDRALEALEPSSRGEAAKADTKADTPRSLALEVALAENAAEVALRRDQVGAAARPGGSALMSKGHASGTSKASVARPHGVRSPGVLAHHLVRLRDLDARRMALADGAAGTPQLPARLRLALWVDLARLLLRLPSRGAATDAPASEDDSLASWRRGLRGARGKEKKIAKALDGLLKAVAPQVQAQALLRRVVDATEGEASLVEAPGAKAGMRGPLALLWRPLGDVERLRWHLRASVSLGAVATHFATKKARRADPTTTRLAALALRATRVDVGALRYVVLVELALRRRDLPAMRAAVRGFLQRPALLLGRAYLIAAPEIRRAIFDRATSLALDLGDGAAALAFAEEAERRAVADALVMTRLSAPGVGHEALDSLLRAASAHREIFAAQALDARGDAPVVWRKQQRQAERRVREAMSRLHRVAPQLAGLVDVSPFPLAKIRALLAKDEVFAGALVVGQRVWLYALFAKGPVKLRPLDVPLNVLRRQARSRKRGSLEHTLGEKLRALMGTARRVRLDLGRLAEGLAPRLPKGVTVASSATLWALLDADTVCLPTIPGAILAAGRDLPSLANYRTIAGKDLHRDALEAATTRAGVLVVDRPIRFVGSSAASAEIDMLPGPGAQAPGDRWRLSKTLALPLRYGLVVLSKVHFRAGRERPERILLTRLFHAMGVPRVAFRTGRPHKSSLASRLSGLPAAIAEVGELRAAQAAGLSLYGDPGLISVERKRLWPRRLKAAVFAGAKAFNKRDLPRTICLLERAVRLMDLTGQKKYLGGALLYLTNATALSGQPGRALVPMGRLLVLKEAKLARAPKKGRGRLIALAGVAKSLEQLAWLQLRAKRYGEALKANGRAIAIYEGVKRRALAQRLYAQRSTIAERKGDAKMALRFAREAASVAGKTGKKRPPRHHTRLIASAAYRRVARLWRQRFSNYGAALAAMSEARDLLFAFEPKRLAALRARRAAKKTAKKT
ncbi:MAG: hypothetical protein KAI47_25050, partial [Deltaproteobacteria bacterium]|nr:hypothetical protein [Deltaproteobacteria bacterium]